MNKSITSFLVALLAVFSFSSLAQANQRFVLDLGDQVYQGQSTIGLKRLIKDYYPNANLRPLELKRVRLVAKSARGMGTAELYVGQRYQDQVTVDGNRGEFQNDARWTFSPVVLRSYENGGRQGAWQLELRGRIKVRRIVVVAERTGQGGPGGPGQYVKVKEIKADKFIGEDKNYNVDLRRVKTLRVNGIKRVVDISNITVTYGNGEREYLSELTGLVREGEVLVAQIGGRNIVSIRVACKSPNLFGSSGKIEVGATVR